MQDQQNEHSLAKGHKYDQRFENCGGPKYDTFEYSAIEHLAKTIGLSCFRWQEIWFAMFTACFDASGTDHDQQFLVVAGFVSSANDWIDFDKRWRERLAQDGLSGFHAVEFAQSRGEFKQGWRDNKPRRDKLLSDLMEIIKSHAYRRFACVVENKVMLSHLSKERREFYRLNAYCLAARHCASEVSEWHRQTNPANPVEFVFEDGDSGANYLVERFKGDYNRVPIFKPGRDRITLLGPIVGFTPLQAADFFAYEVFLGCKNMVEQKRKPRWAIEEFITMPGTLGIYEKENVEALEKNLKVCQETKDWWLSIYKGL